MTFGNFLFYCHLNLFFDKKIKKTVDMKFKKDYYERHKSKGALEAISKAPVSFIPRVDKKSANRDGAFGTGISVNKNRPH